MNEDSQPSGNRFLATMLHEIRTPIQTIISTLELLCDTPLNTEQQEYIRQLGTGANVLLQLSNDILDFTKIKNNDFKMEKIPVDVAHIAEHVIDLVSMEAFSKGIEIITSVDYTASYRTLGDPVRIQQVILNIVKNAVKFTSQGYVEVRLERQKGSIRVEVEDSGIGVSKEQEELIFNDFYQGQASTTRQYGGTGLGLSICKNLVSRMGGTIGVYPNPNERGSVFYFTLPVNAECEVSEDKGAETSKFERRILIVDDNERALRSMEKKLRGLGCTSIDTASSGEDALKKMLSQAQKSEGYDLCFIDMIMKGMDGWRFVDSINKHQEINGAKLYLMVPEGQMGRDAKMKLLDWFNGYIYKPIKRNALAAILFDFSSTPLDLECIEECAENESAEKENGENEADSIKEKEIGLCLSALVADDYDPNRELLKIILQRFGITVQTAHNGQQAIEIIKRNFAIDLVFMDIEMPIKNGIEASKEIRSMGFNGVIIACTANNDPEDLLKYYSYGINEILTKPFRKDQIRIMIEKWNELLHIPNGRHIISTSIINDSAKGIWDLNAFKAQNNNDIKLCKRKVAKYLETMKSTLAHIKPEEANGFLMNILIDRQLKALENASHEICTTKISLCIFHIKEAIKQNDKDRIQFWYAECFIEFEKIKPILTYWETTA